MIESELTVALHSRLTLNAIMSVNPSMIPRVAATG